MDKRRTIIRHFLVVYDFRVSRVLAMAASVFLNQNNRSPFAVATSFPFTKSTPSCIPLRVIAAASKLACGCSVIITKSSWLALAAAINSANVPVLCPPRNE